MSEFKDSLPVDKVVTNEEILEALRQYQAEEKRRIPIFTEEEINTLRMIASERKAFKIVFTKGKMLFGMLAAVILFFSSLLVDWRHLLPRFSGG